jgi:predicted ATPase/DNA-binding winged helix-turn-helix (wHTH) protein
MNARPLDYEDFSFGATVVVPRRRELFYKGVKVGIGDRAFDLLLALIEARGSVLSKDRIMARVWRGRIVEENTLEGQISILRRALGDDRTVVRTVAGRGYQFVGELTEAACTATNAPATLAPAPVSPGMRLPANISPIIGRETALRELADLALSHRLVTLVGAGGVGKTRLAVEVARQLAPHFAEGVYLAELAATSSPDYLPTTLAVALGFPPGDGTPSLDKLAATLHERHMLLLLDNCEHLIESAATMAETLLRVAPRATIIATSRESLRVAGEYIYRVPSLELPPDDGADDAREFGAIRLFEERVGTNLLLCGKGARALPLTVRICRQLDGIPLAIELAAACVPTFGLQGVAERLDDRFQLLTHGARTALPRQQTLRATIDWSYDLLPETQRTVLNRLSLFAGPFTLESAQAVASSAEIATGEVVNAIIELVHKSLLASVPVAGRMRYRLLETTRAYAREQLRASGQLRDWTGRHACHYLDLFRHAEELAATRADIDWNAVYTPHLEDLRAAIAWGFSDEGDPGIAVDLTIASIPLSMQLALMDECLSRVNTALASLSQDAAPAGEREMKLHAARGTCLLCHTAGPQTGAAFSAALELAEQAANPAYQLLGLWGCWNFAYLNGRFAETVPLARRLGEVAAISAWPSDRFIADRLTGMAHLLVGELDEARTHLERAFDSTAPMPRAQRIRFLYDERVVAHTSLSYVLWFQGLPEQATRVAQQALADAEELDHPASLCYALSEAVCTLALLTGDDATLACSISTMKQATRRHGVSTWKARVQMWQALLDLREGCTSVYETIILPGLDAIGAKRFFISMTPFLTTCASVLGERGKLTEAQALLQAAMERALKTSDECSLAELLRAQAELMLLGADSQREAQAQALLEDALARARRHQFAAWELRCATSLAALWQRNGKDHAARALLEPVYERFPEGFDSLDLRTARALLSSPG